MVPDALTYRIAKHAEIVVTGRGVVRAVSLRRYCPD
jgi:hypothetical protein